MDDQNVMWANRISLWGAHMATTQDVGILVPDLKVYMGNNLFIFVSKKSVNF